MFKQCSLNYDKHINQDVYILMLYTVHSIYTIDRGLMKTKTIGAGKELNYL